MVLSRFESCSRYIANVHYNVPLSMTLQACGYDAQVESTTLQTHKLNTMIETKETILEYWIGMKLKRKGHALEARTRNKLDAWFIAKGFAPVHRAYSLHFSEYYNETSGDAVHVDEIDFFDDSLVSNHSWAMIWSKERCMYYIVPYGALRDVGLHWGHREIHYTDKDNSSEKDLQKTLETLIDLTLAYEI